MAQVSKNKNKTIDEIKAKPVSDATAEALALFSRTPLELAANQRGVLTESQRLRLFTKVLVPEFVILAIWILFSATVYTQWLESSQIVSMRASFWVFLLIWLAIPVLQVVKIGVFSIALWRGFTVQSSAGVLSKYIKRASRYRRDHYVTMNDFKHEIIVPRAVFEAVDQAQRYRIYYVTPFPDQLLSIEALDSFEGSFQLGGADVAVNPFWGWYWVRLRELLRRRYDRGEGRYR